MIQTANPPKLKAHHHAVKLMGCGFVVTAVDADKQLAWDAIRAGIAEMVRIEHLISSWRTDTATHLINEHAGIKAIKASAELIGLIKRSIRISELTSGAFDITGNLSRYYYQFDKQEHPALSAEKVKELRDLVDYRLIEIDEEKQTVFLKKRGMKMGFGGIGKGYAAYRAKVVMEAMGIRSGLINASGDLMAWGSPPNKKEWEVYVPNPENRKEVLFDFSIPHGSVVTSGNHENYTLVDGKRLSHIIDPRSGLPVEGVQSVSVFCPNPEFADALATAFTVMGINASLNLANQLNGVECLLIDSDNNRYFSNQFK